MAQPVNRVGWLTDTGCFFSIANHEQIG